MKLKSNLSDYRLFFISAFFLSIISLSYYLSFALRYEFRIPDDQWLVFLYTIPFLIVIRLSFAHYFGLFRGWLGYAEISDLLDILKYDTLSSLAFTLFLVLFQKITGFSRSILLLDWTVNLLCVGGARFIRRFIKETIIHLRGKKNTDDKKHVLIVGAGDAGIMILREIKNNPRLNYHAIGFIDDNERKKGKRINGIPVLGNQQDIPEIAAQNKIDEIIIAIPSATSSQLNKIVNICKKSGVKVKTTPSLSNLIDGTVHLYQVRDVAIEDLLGRKPVFLDHSGIQNEMKSKKILITGAGGSIGSELAWQVAQFDFQQLILFERGESDLYQIEMKLKKFKHNGSIIPVIGDVLDNHRLREIMEKYRPDVVYHAAAYKHVPMMELNSLEALRNNLLGTLNMAKMSIEYGVKKFIFVSTDKAVRPTSIMGATKRASELALKAMSNSHTRFIAVRFGNVLDSRGSVVPVFRKQISEGGPVTVTHPFIIRYFMSIPEACQLILQAAAIGEGGELFLLDMGEPVKIVDLAENLIRLGGLEPYKDIDIKFTGLRPGEKLYEELFNHWEELLPTSHKKIMRVNTGVLDSDFVVSVMDELERCIQNRDLNQAIYCLKKIVPSFKERYQRHEDCLCENIGKGSELNIKFKGREFKGKISSINKEESIQIQLSCPLDLDKGSLTGKLEATFFHPAQNKVVRFHSVVISTQNGSGPTFLTVKYPPHLEIRDDLRVALS